MDLVLNTYGATLCKDNDAFIVISHDGKQRIPPAGIKSILISKGAQISSDAALLAIENEIDVLFVDNVGKPIGRIWSSKYGSVSTIRKGQLDFTFSKDAVQWIKDQIIFKIENEEALLLSMLQNDLETQNIVNKTLKRIEDYRNKIKALEGEVVPDIASGLRGWEGAAAKIYFTALNLFLPEEYRFKEREQHPATDVTNCMLNYAYGILYGKIEGALIKAGIDPYVGIFHRDDYNRPVLVFDIIERYRVWADYVVVNLCIQKVINEDCYSVREDGSYWLENLGRRIVIQSLNDYLEEVINIKGTERSRLTHIQLFAQNLAQLFKKYA